MSRDCGRVGTYMCRFCGKVSTPKNLADRTRCPFCGHAIFDSEIELANSGSSVAKPEPETAQSETLEELQSHKCGLCGRPAELFRSKDGIVIRAEWRFRKDSEAEARKKRQQILDEIRRMQRER